MLTLNILEESNNTAKVIKHVGNRFQDFEYFSLKLKSAFPGKRLQGAPAASALMKSSPAVPSTFAISCVCGEAATTVPVPCGTARSLKRDGVSIEDSMCT